MYGCESWTINKVECQKIDAFWTVVLEKTLESPLVCKEIQPVHPKRNKSWISLEELMVKLKLQYFGHLLWRTESLEKILMLGKIEGGKRRGWQRLRWLGWHHWITGHEFEYTLEVGDGQGSLVCCSPWGCKETWLSNGTITIIIEEYK